MLKLLKWAYSLGVRNERQRIATYLSNVQAQAIDRFNDPFREDVINSKKVNENKKLKKAVDSRIIDIISELFRGEERYQRGASVMFPEEEK